MSHFTVAVISKTPKDVEKLLAPYQENNYGDCPREYLEYFDLEELHKKEYESGSFKKIKDTVTCEEFGYYDERFWKRGENGNNELHLPENHSEILVLYKDEYPAYSDFLEQHHSYTADEDGRFGYWDNPNAKWDYWRVGGRWRGLLKASAGANGELAWELKTEGGVPDAPGHYDCAQIKNIDFSMDAAIYEEALRFWEVCVEMQPLREEEKKEDFFSIYTPEYYLERYVNKETYAKEQAGFSTWALIAPDGSWHEKGEMGWWGFSDATSDTIKTYTEFLNKILAEISPEYYITIVDCHI